MPTGSPNAASRLALVLTLCCLFLTSPAAAEGNRHVLVLYSHDRLLPANLEAEAGLRETMAGSAELAVEFLGYPRFAGESYARTMAQFLLKKYALWPPDILIAGGDDAFVFLLRHRAELFPQIPVVHMGVEKSLLTSIGPLPADVVGVPMESDFPGTIELALRWHPRARRLVLVTGAGAQDRQWEAQLHDEVTRFKDRAATEFLAGLPTDALLQQLGELGQDTVVFTPGYFRDGAGRDFTPRAAVEGMAAATTAPIYGPFDTFMGSGIVGGAMPSFRAMGREAGRTVTKLLEGAAPASLRLPQIMPAAVQVDWRQVRRWGIDPATIPDTAVIQFKAPTVLEEHPRQAIAAAVVFLFQSGLIVWLLTERRRRRLAELAMQKQRFELLHAARLAVAGELTASIAHEINQPLGAILSNADAADLLLDSDPDRHAELRAILADIRRDDLRASEVIGRLRSLLTKHRLPQNPFNLSQVLHDVAAMLGSEARRRRVSLDLRLSQAPLTMVGDRIQIQQVLINLILNAMEAVADLPEDRRTILVSAVSAGSVAGGIAVAVRDQGPGIATDQLLQVFDSFFSTKREGMGLGLAITRTIVEAHGGRIWAESDAGQGAVFHVALPALRAKGIRPVAPA